MKFVTIRQFRSSTATLRKDLETERDLVLTSNGKPIAIVSAVSPDNVEEELTALRRARARMALDRIRQAARTQGKDSMTMDEIDAAVAEARAARRLRGDS